MADLLVAVDSAKEERTSVIPQDVAGQSLLPTIRLEFHEGVCQVRIRIFLADPHDSGSGSLTNNMVLIELCFFDKVDPGILVFITTP